MKPVHSITLTVKGEKVYHAGKELDLSNGEVTELAMEFGKINDLPTIQIKAEGDVKVGTITDIKLQLREADALRLRYVTDGSIWTATVSRAMILLEPNEETKQNAFVELEKKVRQAYTELREDLSMEKFSKKMNDLSAEERQVIYEAIPIKVSEAEPKPKVII